MSPFFLSINWNECSKHNFIFEKIKQMKKNQFIFAKVAQNVAYYIKLDLSRYFLCVLFT